MSETAALKELVLEKFRSVEIARELQAKEYARRLDVLNHAHDEIRQILAATVSREKFEDYQEQQRLALEAALLRANEKINTVSDAVKARDSRGQGLHQGWLILVAVIGIILALAAILYGPR